MMWKKQLIFLTFCMLMCSSSIFAQDAIGILGGFNITNMLRSPALPSTSHEERVRFAGGAMVEFGLIQGFALQLEPMYIQKGANFDFIDTESEQLDARRDEVDLTYLEVPILLKFRLLNRETGPYLLAGPSVGVLLSAKQGNRARKRDIKDQRKSLDIGIGGGGGVFLSSDRVKLFVEGRYNYGLGNIDDASEDGSDLRNNGFRILLGILL
ncbi:MAG: porin family protein [bacterium]